MVRQMTGLTRPIHASDTEQLQTSTLESTSQEMSADMILESTLRQSGTIELSRFILNLPAHIALGSAVCQPVPDGKIHLVIYLGTLPTRMLPENKTHRLLSPLANQYEDGGK